MKHMLIMNAMVLEPFGYVSDIFNYCVLVLLVCSYCGNIEHCTMLYSSIQQVPENDVWEEVRSNSFLNNLDESAYNFLKGKAVEGVTELLEKRTNSNGFVFHH